MEITQEQVTNILQGELAPNAYDESVLVPKLQAIAKLKDLEVFLFKDEGLKEYFSNINSALGVVLMARTEESARWNLQNFRKCYLVKLDT